MKVFDFIKEKIKLNKEPKKRLFLKQVSLLCAILVMLISVVWAWFSVNKGEADASGMNITMGTSDSLLISLNGGSNFTNKINLLSKDEDVQAIIGQANNLFDTDGKLLLSMQDITSDGQIFFRPKFNEVDGQRIPDTTAEWTHATKNRAYISQNIVFRTTKPCDIYMGSGTAITTSDSVLVSDVTGTIKNPVSGTNFSKDCIVGALRISAVADDECKFVCIPRSDIELDRSGDTPVMLTGNALSGESEIHVYYDSTYQTTGDTVEEWNTVLNFDGTQLITSTNQKVVRTNAEGKDEEGYEATATINLWLEGCDPEVTRLLSGGKYQVTFDFVATEKN